MGAQNLSGKIVLSGACAPSPGRTFHSFLSKIKPDDFNLERMSVYEVPMRARLEYAAKDRPDFKPVLNVEFSESECSIVYSILPSSPDAKTPEIKKSFFRRLMER